MFSISDADKENGFSFLVSLKTTSPYGSVKPLSKVLQVCIISVVKKRGSLVNDSLEAVK